MATFSPSSCTVVPLCLSVSSSLRMSHLSSRVSHPMTSFNPRQGPVSRYGHTEGLGGGNSSVHGTPYPNCFQPGSGGSRRLELSFRLWNPRAPERQEADGELTKPRLGCAELLVVCLTGKEGVSHREQSANCGGRITYHSRPGERSGHVCNVSCGKKFHRPVYSGPAPFLPLLIRKGRGYRSRRSRKSHKCGR